MADIQLGWVNIPSSFTLNGTAITYYKEHEVCPTKIESGALKEVLIPTGATPYRMAINDPLVHLSPDQKSCNKDCVNLNRTSENLDAAIELLKNIPY